MSLKSRIREYLGISTVEKALVEIAEDVTAARSAVANHDRFSAHEHKELRASLAEVRGLLGLSADDLPATRDEIEGRDPHGLG